MSKTSYKKIFIPITAVLLSSVFVANAQVIPGNSFGQNGFRENKEDRFEERQQRLLEKKEEILQRKEELKRASCEKIQERYTKRLNRYSDNENRYLVFFNGIKNKLQNFVERVNTKYPEIDTTKLENDIAELQSMFDELFANYQLYVASMTDTENLLCEDEPENFRTRIQEARETMKQVKTDAQELKNFYLDTIKPDLKDIRDQIKEIKETTDQDEDENDDDSGEDEQNGDSE